MYYTKSQNLKDRVKKFLAGAALLGSAAGCYVTPEEGLGAGLELLGVSGVVKNPIAEKVISKGSDLSYKAGERRSKHETELKEADVELYKESGLSNIRLNEERARKNLENEVNIPDNSNGLSHNTQKALESVLGDDSGIDYKRIIDAVKERCESNLDDYERNWGMIDRAFKLEGITSRDKAELFKTINKIYLHTYLKYENRNSTIDLKGKIKFLEYCINLEEINSIDKYERLNLLSLYMRYTIPIATKSLSDKVAIKFLREKVNFLKELNNNVELNKNEFEFIYTDGSIPGRDFGALCSIESFLRERLKRENPKEYEENFKEFKRIRSAFDATHEITEPQEFFEIAEKAGCLSWAIRAFVNSSGKRELPFSKGSISKEETLEPSINEEEQIAPITEEVNKQ